MHIAHGIIHIHIYIFIYTYIHIYIFIYTYMHIYIYIFIYTYIHTYIYIQVVQMKTRVKQPLNTTSIYDRHVSADCHPQCENTDNYLVLICCLKVFDVIYPFAFNKVKLNKLDANLLDFVAYISVELVVESIGSVCF